jgi:hypothetical protein
MGTTCDDLIIEHVIRAMEAAKKNGMGLQLIAIIDPNKIGLSFGLEVHSEREGLSDLEKARIAKVVEHIRFGDPEENP